MADKTVGMLENVPALHDESLIPVEQSGELMNATGKQFRELAEQAAEQFVEDATEVAEKAEQALAALGNDAQIAKKAAADAAESEAKAKLYANQTESAAGGGVTSFNGRGGHVMPQTGDYTANMVGAVPITETAVPAGEAASFSFPNPDSYVLVVVRGWAAGAECAFLFNGYTGGGPTYSKLLPLSGSNVYGQYISYGINKIAEGYSGHGFTVQNNTASDISVRVIRLQGEHAPVVEMTAENAVSLECFTAHPVSGGGTGANDAATARANLEITPANIGAESAISVVGRRISSPGWYRVGILKSKHGAAASARLFISGSYSSTPSGMHIVEVGWGYYSATLTKVFDGADTGQVSAVRICNDVGGGRAIDIYYSSGSANDMYVGWQAPYGEITPVQFETGELTGTVAAELNLTEWLNPPMQPGVEYRTTERYCGEPVYTMVMHIGYVAVGTTTIEHSLSVKEALGVEILNSGYGYYSHSSAFDLAFDATNVHIVSKEWVAGNIRLILRYTKK